MAHAQCPFCYEGEVVQDNADANHFFCCRCLKKIEMKLLREYSYTGANAG